MQFLIIWLVGECGEKLCVEDNRRRVPQSVASESWQRYKLFLVARKENIGTEKLHADTGIQHIAIQIRDDKNIETGAGRVFVTVLGF